MRDKSKTPVDSDHTVDCEFPGWFRPTVYTSPVLGSLHTRQETSIAAGRPFFNHCSTLSASAFASVSRLKKA